MRKNSYKKSVKGPDVRSKIKVIYTTLAVLFYISTR